MQQTSIERVREAYWNRDPQRYVETCLSVGVPVTDEFLLGQYLADEIMAQRVTSDEAHVSSGRADDCEKGAYAELTRLALGRLPPDVSDRGLRQRASQINRVGAAVGYHLRSYSRMRRDELFSYLTEEVHREVAGLAREHCPDVLGGVRGWNAGMKQLEVLGR